MAPKQALRALLAVSEEAKKEGQGSRGGSGAWQEGEGRLGGEKSAQVAQNVNVNK